MSAVLTLAGLTLREAFRRRVFLASLLVALIFVGFAFLPLHLHEGPVVGYDMAQARDISGRIFAWMGCGVIKFFASILAVTLGAGALSAEAERGALSVIISKPLYRSQVFLGKWLGLMALLAGSMALWALLMAWGIHRQTGTFHPRIFDGVLAAGLFPLLFGTVALCYSSFSGFALSAGLALITAGIGLAQDTLHVLSMALNEPLLESLSKADSYLVPIGWMNHWITRGLGTAGLDMSALMDFRRGGNADVSVTTGDLAYVLCYTALFFIIGLVVWQKRDI